MSRSSRPTAPVTVTLAAGAVALLLAGCGSSTPAAAPKPPATSSAAAATSAAPATSAPAAATTAAAPPAAASSTASALTYVAIKDTFDTQFSCNMNGSTPEIAACFSDQARATDKKIDAVQSAAFDAAGDDAARQAILDDDASWVAERKATCAKAASSGGTMDQINVASCFADESTKRLAAVQGGSAASPSGSAAAAPAATLKQGETFTDSHGTKLTESFVAPDGAHADTVAVAWTVVAGKAGYTVDAQDFPYGPADALVIGTTSKQGTVVAPGAKLSFDVSYPAAGTLDIAPHYAEAGGDIVATWS